MKLLGLLRGFLCCCTFLAPPAKTAFGFQQPAPPPLGSSRATAAVCTSGSAATSPAFQRRQQILHPPLCSSVNRRHRGASRLRAFGGGSGVFGGGFGAFNANPPIETRRDILQRLRLIATGTARQFISGFTNGYLLALVWGLIRGPSLTVESRTVAWGMDFGVLSALFSCANGVAEFALALPTKQKGEEESGDDELQVSLSRRRRRTLLWSIVIRNMMLALYFGRSGGLVKMARSSVLYGGLTYLFVGQKGKRDAERMSGAFGGNANGSMGGGQQPSPDAMKELLLQLMATNGRIPRPPPATMGSPTSSPKRVASPPGASPVKSTSSSSSSASPLFNDEEKSKRDDAVDVEFERIDPGDDGDAK